MNTALEKLKTQVKPKHFQIFYLLTLKQLPAPKVAQTLGVNVGQVYLVKLRVGAKFKKALKEAEAKME